MSFAIGNVAAQMSLVAAMNDHTEVHSAPSEGPTPPPIEPGVTPLQPDPPPIKVGSPSPPPIRLGEEAGVPQPPPIRAGSPNPPPIRALTEVSGPSPPPIKLGEEASSPQPPPIKAAQPSPPPIKASIESSQPDPPPIKAGTDNALLRQGIIIIGGDSLHGGLHPVATTPVAAAALNFMSNSGQSALAEAGEALKTIITGPSTEPPGTAGGGFSGLLHTIANLGRG